MIGCEAPNHYDPLFNFPGTPRYLHIVYLISPHLSPHVGKTPPHINLYIGGEETNGSNDSLNQPDRRKGARRSMSETHPLSGNNYEPGLYEIRIKGHLDNRWSAWFEGLTTTREENGNTLLAGRFDQAALYGLLKKVRDSGMPLISVIQVQSNQTNPYRSEKGDEQ